MSFHTAATRYENATPAEDSREVERADEALYELYELMPKIEKIWERIAGCNDDKFEERWENLTVALEEVTIAKRELRAEFERAPTLPSRSMLAIRCGCGEASVVESAADAKAAGWVLPRSLWCCPSCAAVPVDELSAHQRRARARKEGQ